jgi:hypothetical protein
LACQHRPPIIRGMENDPNQFRRELIERAISLATPNAMGRAACPLCGSDPVEGGWTHEPDRSSGYTVSRGLKRHLDGSHGVVECPVVKAAYYGAIKLATDSAELRKVKKPKEGK